MSMDDLTIHERLSIQMEYVVPLIRDLQRILGEDVVNKALEERIRLQTEEAKAEPVQEIDTQTWADGFEIYSAGDALDFEMQELNESQVDVNVTRCAYAEMMDRLGARDLGPQLICNLDFPMAERAGMTLTRTQTRMQGASHCDFRYKKKV